MVCLTTQLASAIIADDLKISRVHAQKICALCIVDACRRLFQDHCLGKKALCSDLLNDIFPAPLYKTSQHKAFYYFISNLFNPDFLKNIPLFFASIMTRTQVVLCCCNVFFVHLYSYKRSISYFGT